MAEIIYQKVCVLGDGPMGYAMASILAENRKCKALYLYALDKDIFSHLQQYGRHPFFEELKDHPSTHLRKNLQISDSYEECVKDAGLYVLALPSQAARKALRQLRPFLSEGAVLLHTIKGLEPKTGMRVSQIMAEEVGDIIRKGNMLVLSGANIAAEILLGNLATTEIAGSDEKVAQAVMTLFHSQNFRPYYNRDIVGVEYAGILKNVLAVAVGIMIGHHYVKNAKFLKKGYDYGQLKENMKDKNFRLKMKGYCANTIAALNSLGSKDAMMFAMLHKAERHTFNSDSQSWAADKDTSTYGDARNVTFGMMVGIGYAPEEALAALASQGKHLEGYHTAKELYHIAQREKLNVPLFSETYKILYEGKSVEKAFADFMNRPLEKMHKD